MTDPAVRMTFCYSGCDHKWCASYDKSGEGKCWELWHPEFSNGPYCQERTGHAAWHVGGGLEWPQQSHADASLAARFLAASRRIPNGRAAIWLRDDGYIEGTVSGLEDAVRFLGVHGGDD